LKVLHVAQSSEYGLGRYLADLLHDQAAAGWHVAMAGDPASALRGMVDVPWLPWSASRDPGPSVAGEVRALRGLIHSVDPDVVHLHSSKAGLAGRLALRRSRPTIFQPHAWSFFAVHGMKRQAALLWERMGARWADVVVCGSEGERAAGERAGIRHRVWRVVPNAVDTDRFAPGDRDAARSALGLGSAAGGGPLVVCAGRLAVGQKGQDLLLAAWPAVADAVPGVRLVLVGDGPDRARLEDLAAGMAVSFAGSSDDMPSWFRAADLAVQPSRYETLSLSVLEALACGRSVVATDAVGMREAVGDAGAVVPREDAAALAAALVTRLRDPVLAAEEGARGRARVVAAYSRPVWRGAMAAVTELAAARPPR
jgi:glycosyltransferase involved in cell wall biosynthesis